MAWQNQRHEPEPMKPLNVCALVVALTMATVGVATQTDETTFTAVSANVADPGGPVKIRIQRWSTSEQAAPLVAALNPPPAAPRGAGPAGSEGARAGGAAGRAGRARGRGRGAAPAAPLSPTAALAQAIGRGARQSATCGPRTSPVTRSNTRIVRCCRMAASA